MASVSASNVAVKNSALPSKELALFKQILRQYEHKQYKKGLKNAEQILKKCPEHGETLAMKGLFLSHLNNRPEAYECVKKGLRYHLTSPICWHVYGLLYRSDKNYEEAMKCYRHALKYDKDNVQVLRDFSYLQTQMRDYEGFNETVSRLLHLRSNQRAFWIAFAISHHLLKNYDAAVRVIDAFRDTEKDKQTSAIDYESSELLMYRNSILVDSGALEDALKDIVAIEKNICDRLAWMERRSFILLQLGRYEAAYASYSELVHRNPENRIYLEGLLKSKKFDSSSNDVSMRENIYKFLMEKLNSYPRSQIIQKMVLDYASGIVLTIPSPVVCIIDSGNYFYSFAENYLKQALRKGVPSLFNNLKNILEDFDKSSTIFSIVESYKNELSLQTSEPPSSLPWTLYFISQYYAKKDMLKKAEDYINQAIKHSPTLLELYMFKAKIYKKMGDFKLAAEIMNEAREFDLQDRFINSKATKYYIKADMVDKAEQTIALFAKQGSIHEKMLDLVDMQCMWFAIETGISFVRQENLGLALKKFHQIAHHFRDFTDDQFDFHTYCLRKLTIRSYMDLLALEDNLYSQKYYMRTAENAAKIYIKLFDDSEYAKKQIEISEKTHLDLIQKQKEEKKITKRDEKQSKDNQVADKLLDNDPAGLQFLKTDKYLDEALSFLKPILQIGKQNMKITNLAFKIFIRKNLVLLAYKSLHLAEEMDRNDSLVVEMKREYEEFLNNLKEPINTILPEPVLDVMKSQDDMKHLEHSMNKL